MLNPQGSCVDHAGLPAPPASQSAKTATAKTQTKVSGWKLYTACADGHAQQVRDWQAKGKLSADVVEWCDRSGVTPLIISTKNGHTACVELLLANNADVEAEDDDGRTAFMYAARYGYITYLEMLLDSVPCSRRRALINAKDVNHKTALIWAAFGRHGACVRWLLEWNAEVDAQERYSGTTALSWAVQRDSMWCTQLLLTSGADVSLPDSQGLVAADHAGRAKMQQALDEAVCGMRHACVTAYWTLQEEKYLPRALAGLVARHAFPVYAHVWLR